MENLLGKDLSASLDKENIDALINGDKGFDDKGNIVDLFKGDSTYDYAKERKNFIAIAASVILLIVGIKTYTTFFVK